jgi:signal transduction histidine kinase
MTGWAGGRYGAAMRSALWLRVGGSVRAYPLLADTVLAVALTLMTMLVGRQDPPAPWRPFDGPAYVLAALVTLPTFARRRAPVAVLLTCCTFWIWYVAEGYWLAVTTYGPILALYTVAATQPWPAVAGCALLSGSIGVYSGLVSGVFTPSLVAQSIVIPIAIWKIGHGAQQLTVRNAQLATAAAQLHRGQEERARLAVIDERVRIARELHDVVAHHMSVISIQAGLARYVLESDPPTARTALETTLQASGEALDEIRRLLALLRIEPETGGEPAEVYGPAPSLAYLPELFNRVRAAGVPVDVTVTGRPHPLSPGAELCVFRVIQESLTNVLKHATPAQATVRLHYGADSVTASVIDDGRPAASAEGPPDNCPNGLIGMRERAMLYGGTLTAGPREPSGFAVTLTLPTGTASSD